MPRHPTEPLGEGLRVAVLAARADLGAAADGVPCRVRPLDRGGLAHRCRNLPSGRNAAGPRAPRDALPPPPLPEAHTLGVEPDLPPLGVARGAAADLAVGGVRRESPGVPDRRRVDA